MFNSCKFQLFQCYLGTTCYLNNHSIHSSFIVLTRHTAVTFLCRTAWCVYMINSTSFSLHVFIFLLVNGTDTMDTFARPVFVHSQYTRQCIYLPTYTDWYLQQSTKICTAINPRLETPVHLSAQSDCTVYIPVRIAKYSWLGVKNSSCNVIKALWEWTQNELDICLENFSTRCLLLRLWNVSTWAA